MIIVPSLVHVGAPAGEAVGEKGLLLTAVVGGAFTLVSIVIYYFYDEKDVLNVVYGKKGE